MAYYLVNDIHENGQQVNIQLIVNNILWHVIIPPGERVEIPSLSHRQAIQPLVKRLQLEIVDDHDNVILEQLPTHVLALPKEPDESRILFTSEWIDNKKEIVKDVYGSSELNTEDTVKQLNEEIKLDNFFLGKSEQNISSINTDKKELSSSIKHYKSELESLTKAQLKNKCVDAELDTKGNAKELIDRLVDHKIQHGLNT